MLILDTEFPCCETLYREVDVCTLLLCVCVYNDGMRDIHMLLAVGVLYSPYSVSLYILVNVTSAPGEVSHVVREMCRMDRVTAYVA